MKSKSIFSIIGLCCILLLPLGCTPAEEKHAIKQVVETMASEEFAGRLTGTAGNENAVRFLEGKMAEFGLEKLGDSYIVPYEHQYYPPDKQHFTLTTYDENGNKREWVRGRDYLERTGFSNFYWKGPLHFAFDDTQTTERFVLLDSPDDQYSAFETSRGLLIKTASFSKTLSVDTLKKPIIQISDALYNELTQHSQTTIEVQASAVSENITAYNVVGIIAGENRKEAIVLSAHLDHVGQVGETIFPGAVDNGSGVAILLDLAQKLQTHAAAEPFARDIIICFFNGEESGRQGSRALVPLLKERYEHIYNINIDSIRSDAPIRLAAEEASDPFVETIQHFLTDHGIRVNVDSSGGSESDHVSFAQAGIRAVSIGQDNKQTIHTAADTPEQLDYAFLQTLSDQLYNLILAHHGFTIQHDHTDQETKVKIVFTNISDFSTFYPSVYFPKELAGFALQEVSILAPTLGQADDDMTALEHLSFSYTKQLDKETRILDIAIEPLAVATAVDTTKEVVIDGHRYRYFMLDDGVVSIHYEKTVNGRTYQVLLTNFKQIEQRAQELPIPEADAESLIRAAREEVVAILSSL